VGKKIIERKKERKKEKKDRKTERKKVKRNIHDEKNKAKEWRQTEIR
jgi:hypothetical protein